MKEFIVILSTVLLGIILAGLVLGFGDKAETLNESVSSQLDGVFSAASPTPGE